MQTFNLQNLIEEFIQNKTGNYWLGYKGVGNLERVLRVMGYKNVEAFLASNTDFIHLILKGIKNTDEPIWIDDFKKELDYDL